MTGIIICNLRMASIFEDASYAQTYVVLKDETASRGAEAKKSDGQEVLFACGNWCYRGQIQFNNLKMNLSELPIIIPTLQRQQASLRYFCSASVTKLSVLRTNEVYE